MSEILLRSGRLVGPTQVTGGWVLVAGERIACVGPDRVPPPEPAGPRTTVDLHGATMLPGFIDLHVHGGGGGTFDDGAEAIRAGRAAHRAHGTTRSLLSLVTNPLDEMVTSIAVAADLIEADPTLLGIHLEGPFLSPARKGAHDPASLIDPDPAVWQRFLSAGRGRVRMITLAPERPGGLDMIRAAVGAGVHAAVGHSDATYDVAAAAFAAGADIVTHAFNGMRPLHHRDPAIIGAAMDAGVVLEVINDGVHLHDATVRLLRSIAPHRLALITDAMAAAGAGDGDYRLGAFDVRVTNGVARLAGGESIAGSTLTLDVAVRRAVHDVGMDLVEAVNAASLVPATLLGISDDHGALAAGRLADVVITDEDLTVRAVMVGGVWADDRRP